MESRSGNLPTLMDGIIEGNLDEMQNGYVQLPDTAIDEHSSNDDINELRSSSFDSRSPHSSTSSPPPRAEESDRTLHHIGLEDFGKALETAARSIYPSSTTPRYARVYVLLVLWETQDPKLSVECEIRGLRRILEHVYKYNVEEFRIPDSESHAEVSEKINSFVKVGGNSNNHLKIVHYAGQSRLSRTRELLWSTLPEKKNAKCPIVVWSGIQRSLEMAQSDVLILLDCCSSGITHASEGNGITELICACSFDTKTNEFGPYSFTHALNTELKLLSKKLIFSVGELYTSIYTRMQSFLAQAVENERYPPPVHLAFTQDASSARSIVLSVHDSQAVECGSSKEANPKRLNIQHIDGLDEPTKRRRMKERLSTTTDQLNSYLNGSGAHTVQADDDGLLASSLGINSCQTKRTSSPPNDSNYAPRGIPKDSSYPLDAPRALFAVRFREDLCAEDLSVELFRDWLRSIPAGVEEVRVEASFKCFSTLLLITLPISMRAYIPDHPAIFYLGTVLSPISLPSDKGIPDALQNGNETRNCASLKMEQGMGKAGPFRGYDVELTLRGSDTRMDDKFHRIVPPALTHRKNDSIADQKLAALSSIDSGSFAKGTRISWNELMQHDDVSPVLSDCDVDYLESRRSSPILFENSWAVPPQLIITSATNSSMEYSPSLDSLSPVTYAQDFTDLVEQAPYGTTGDKAKRKSIGPRKSKVASDLSAAFRYPRLPTPSDAFEESFKLVGRSSVDYDNMARDHPLYHNVTPKADGLYHCPFENDPKANCTHKPEKLHCNYDKFVDSHLKPYKCKVSTCKDLCFSSTACLLRHEREAHAMHGHGDKPFLCTYDNCERGIQGNGFPRHWNLRDHLKRVHNDPGLPQSNTSGSPPPSVTLKGKKRKADDTINNLHHYL